MPPSTTKSNIEKTIQSQLRSAIRPERDSSSSSSDLAHAVRQALSAGIGGEQVLNIAREETINEVDYVPADTPEVEKPKRRKRGKNADL